VWQLLARYQFQVFAAEEEWLFWLVKLVKDIF
jgi:hypothetical protein